MSFLNNLAKKAQQLGHTIGHDAGAVANTASRVYDQVNPLDNGLSYQTRQVAPNVPQRSVYQQATHNGATNFVGGAIVKPVARFPINASSVLYNSGVAPVFNLPKQDLRHGQAASGLVRAINRPLGATGSLRQTGGDALQTALTIGTAGIGGAIEGGVARGATMLAPKLAATAGGKLAARTIASGVTGAAVGGPYNVAAQISNDTQKLTKQGVLNAYKEGTKYGAVLGAATPLAGAVLSKGIQGAAKGADMARFHTTEATGKTFNGLKPQQIITNPNHLQALDDFQTSMRDGVAPPVQDQQRIVNALHEVKQNNGLDFLSGSPDARAQRIEQYQQQWHEGIKRYQNKLVDQQAKPSVLADENGGLNNRGGSNAKQLKQQLGQVSKAMKAAQGTPGWDALAKKADTLSSQLEEARFNQASAKGKRLLKPLDQNGSTPVNGPLIPVGKLAKDKQPLVVENKLTKGGKAGNQNLSPKVQTGISGEHAVRNTQALQDEALAQANSLPIDKHIQAAHEALAVPSGKIDDKTVALAQQAIERADAAGRHEDAIGIHDALSEHLVKQGQTIQAASLLYRLSPQGLFYKGLKDLKKGGANVTPELEAKLRSYADQAKNATNLDAKERAMAQFHKAVADNIPKSAANGALSVWKAGLLSGVKTQGGNFVSNATFGTLHGISNPIAAGVDKLISLKTGERTKTATLRGLPQGTQQGLRSGFDTMKTGIDARNIGGGKYEVHGELNFKNPVIQNVFGKTSNLVFRGMNAADQPFYYAALKNNLADLAKADGINKGLRGAELDAHIKQTMANPTQHMAETAKVSAQKAVLAQDSKIASSLTKFTQAHPSAQVLAPFIKVPTNFLTRTLDYTPVGAIKEVTKQIQAGHLDQRALSEAIGEATTGSALIYLGAQLANHNMLSGQYPQNDQKESARWKAEGIQPNSIKIGHSWVSLNYLGPIGLLFGAGKDYVDATKKGDNGTIQAITGFGKNLTGQSFLTGFSGFANAINDPQRSAKSFINSQAGSIIPTWSADVANFADKYQREVNSVGDSIKSRIPGARNTLPVKQDVYGNQLGQRTGALNQLLNPLKPSDSRGNTVINEVSRLHSADPNNKDLQVTPTPINKTLKVNGQDVKLNNKQVHDLQNAIGQYTQQKWGEEIKTPEYQKATDAEKAAKLDDIRKTATEVATREYVTKNNVAAYNKPASKKAVAMATGSKDINSLTGKTKGTSNTDLYKSNDAEYKALQDKYKTALSDPKTPVTKKYELQRSLDEAKIGANYSKNVRDLYGMGKTKLADYTTKNQIPQSDIDAMVAYGDALQAAGLGNNKYRDSKGNVSVEPKAKGTSSGRKSTGSKKVAKAKLPSFKATNTASLTASRSIANKVRSSTIKSSGSKKVAFSTKIRKTKSYTLNRRTA